MKTKKEANASFFQDDLLYKSHFSPAPHNSEMKKVKRLFGFQKVIWEI
jgi:hypothetical protein